jgi:hypothetical protein
MGKRMNIGVQTRIGLIVLAAGFAVSAHSQVEDGHPASAQTPSLAPAPAPSEQRFQGMVIREIDDPHTGDHWLLMLDPSRPGAPGRMVLAAAGVDPNRQREPGDAASRPATDSQNIPVIHAGDRLVVEESTPLVKTRLVAVALGQAVSGASFNARLAIGGNVVRAVAVAPGHAVFAQRAGGRP